MLLLMITRTTTTTMSRGDMYEIIDAPDAAAGKAIKCLQCGMTSYNPNDVEHKYCGNCHIFHE